MPAVDELVKKGAAVLAAPSDRDVQSRTYEELMEEADRSGRLATLQFATPVILEISGEIVPFPVIQAIFRGYVEIWKTFSNADLPGGADALRHIRTTDFKISCVSTSHGPGAQGWVRLEMETGRTEEEISLFNCLIDFAFFCGSGLHADEGLGQTRRIGHRQGQGTFRKTDGRAGGGALY
jgi:CRISPR/Cas system endoribonuclease Cas6 (RAMP superfamily)